MDKADLLKMFSNSTDAIDLLLFAYAKAENVSRDPESHYGKLQENLGKFAAISLIKRQNERAE